MSDMAVRALIADVQEEIRAMAEQLVDERALADQLGEALAAILAVESLPRARTALAAWREARQS